MGRSRHCSEEQCTLIKKFKIVQSIIGCSVKMISKSLKWRAKPETRGRKQKTTIKMDHRITRVAKAQPMISSRMIKDSLVLPVSTVTVEDVCVKLIYLQESPAKILYFFFFFFLKALEKQRNILWTDESKNSSFKPQYTVKTLKNSGASIMAWACFTYYGVGPIYLIPGIMDQFGYVDNTSNYLNNPLLMTDKM
uniref:Uncharacterized protein n=1 Tax=Echeneis naucrates TaxID=173247 RepID=A0A665UI46_ECHNA